MNFTLTLPRPKKSQKINQHTSYYAARMNIIEDYSFIGKYSTAISRQIVFIYFTFSTDNIISKVVISYSEVHQRYSTYLIFKFL